jgi:hypothetical protein
MPLVANSFFSICSLTYILVPCPTLALTGNSPESHPLSSKTALDVEFWCSKLLNLQEAEAKGLDPRGPESRRYLSILDYLRPGQSTQCHEAKPPHLNRKICLNIAEKQKPTRQHLLCFLSSASMARNSLHVDWLCIPVLRTGIKSQNHLPLFQLCSKLQVRRHKGNQVPFRTKYYHLCHSEVPMILVDMK